MRSCILFIILGFIQSVICCSEDSNHPQNESDLVCPISWFRRKRAIDYTRWRANEDTTPQFLVKVLDEDISPPNNKKVVAVNIHPITKGVEKIIIGGALPPPTTPVPDSDAIREYTRFVPPTTVPDSSGENVVVAPGFTPIKRPPPALKGNSNRHSQRDESPPANPQFLIRTPAPHIHQYAPVAAVAFTKRTTAHSPLTPSFDIEDKVQMTGRFIPTRTSELPAMSVPTRTEDILNGYSPYDIFEDSRNLIFMTRTTLATYTPVRTTTSKSITADIDMPIPKNILEEDIRRSEHKHKSDKESDVSYNMMFYEEETSKGDAKTEVYDERDKHEESSTSVNYDDHKEHDENDLKEAAAISGIKEEIEINDIPAAHLENKSFVVNTGNVRDIYISKNNVSGLEFIKEPAPIMQLKDRFKMRLQPCNLIKIRALAFNTPRTLHEITAQLKLWADSSPVAKLVDITSGNYTTLDNPIYMMIVDDPTSGQVVSAKQTVMVVAGIQGRDHHAVAAAIYLLYQLIERTSAHAELLSKYRFWIIPVFNPDGYDYSSTFPQRREWMKNLRQNWNLCKERASCQSCARFGLGCTVQPCYGVNLDRNFEYQWIPTDELRTEHPCGPLYAGTRQLSEPETLALTQFLHDQRVPLYTFIALKEGDVLGVLYPYSHTKKKRTLDHIYRQRATAAANAAHSISGRYYVAGQTSEYLPLYAGGIEDWIDGHLGVDNTYTIMMFRPSESYGSKFLTERVVHEAFAAVDTLLLQSIGPSKAYDTVQIVSRNLARSAASRCIIPTALIVLASLPLRYLG